MPTTPRRAAASKNANGFVGELWSTPAYRVS
jgi:hypothetical protein